MKNFGDLKEAVSNELLSKINGDFQSVGQAELVAVVCRTVMSLDTIRNDEKGVLLLKFYDNMKSIDFTPYDDADAEEMDIDVEVGLTYLLPISLKTACIVPGS